MEDFWYRVEVADGTKGWAYGFFVDLAGGGPPSFEAGWDNPGSYEVVTVRYERTADGESTGPLGFTYRDPLMDDTASDLTADVDADGIWRMRYRGSVWVRAPKRRALPRVGG